MTVPATQDERKPLALRPQPTDDLRPILRKLFNSYEQPWAGAPPRTEEERRVREAMMDDRTASYKDGLTGLPAWAIEQARLDFVSGRVERKNRHKLPSAEEVAVVAKIHLDAEVKRQAEQAHLQRQMQERKRLEQFLASRPPAEERARQVKEIMARAGRQMETE